MTNGERKKLLRHFGEVSAAGTEPGQILISRLFLSLLADMEARQQPYEVVELAGYEGDKLFRLKDIIKGGRTAFACFGRAVPVEDMQRVIDTFVGMALMAEADFCRVSGRVFAVYAEGAGVSAFAEAHREEDVLQIIGSDGEVLFEEGADEG